jgi:peptide/nickel transport system substrate-binding protein
MSRNPYFHRVDEQGRQLPYIDEVVVQIASSGLIPAKTGSGESDLQARYLTFDDFTFLKRASKHENFEVHLWKNVKGAQLALYPNMNHNDPVWRKLFRDVRFRRALSLGIDRDEINEVMYLGLALTGNNTVLPASPLYKPEYRSAWARYDPDAANALLDEIGLTERNERGTRLLPDGRPLAIIVETAGESTEQTDMLELVHDHWGRLGIKLYTKPLEREVWRNRIFAGETLMSIWTGLENGVPTPDMAPSELAPLDQNQLEWPKWGQYHQTDGEVGEPIDMALPQRLYDLYGEWVTSGSRERRTEIWHEMLKIHAEQQYTIGVIAGARQPVVARENLRNLPEEGVYNWDPGAYFGMYLPDTFWFDTEQPVQTGKAAED